MVGATRALLSVRTSRHSATTWCRRRSSDQRSLSDHVMFVIDRILRQLRNASIRSIKWRQYAEAQENNMQNVAWSTWRWSRDGSNISYTESSSGGSIHMPVVEQSPP